MQVLEMSQRTTYAEGKYIRSTLDDLMAEMDLLEKQMDCAETLWTKEEEGEGGFNYEGTHEQNIDNEELNELMENCTEEEMQDVFSGINWNLLEEDENVKERGGTIGGLHASRSLSPCIIQGGTVRWFAKLVLFLLVVMCLVPVVLHPYLPFRLDLPGLD